MFPSPTGVNYYEYCQSSLDALRSQMSDGFRPQQGLTIMNGYSLISEGIEKFYPFPSPTGVNYYELYQESYKDLLKVVSVPNRG